MANPKVTFWCRYGRYRAYLDGENSKPLQFEGNIFSTDNQAQIDFLRKNPNLFKEMKQESSPAKKAESKPEK